MKRIVFIALLIVVMTSAYGIAQMGQGRMMGSGMMGTQPQEQPGQTPYGAGYYPCPMGGPGMMGYGMGPGMMGYGMGPGMMGHMGGMMGYGMGPGMMGHMGGMMGYGAQGAYDDEATRKFLDDTAGLRKKLHEKKFEYFEALRNPKADRNAVRKLEKEILDLQWDIYEKSPQ
ncbi:MAG: hypothetical protein JSU90_02580 [Nitrospiraceae bacterium]|nr:MAG: hypothetical protein JSU90_02580 [Nitrospiraceae bacterium]